MDWCEVVRVGLCSTEGNGEFVIDLCCSGFAAYVADASVLSHDGCLEFGPLVFADAEALCGGSVVLVAASVLPAGGLVVGASSFVGGEVGAAWLCAAARWCFRHWPVGEWSLWWVAQTPRTVHGFLGVCGPLFENGYLVVPRVTLGACLRLRPPMPFLFLGRLEVPFNGTCG